MPVSRLLTRLPIVKPKSSTAAIGSIVLMPLNISFITLSTVYCFCATQRIQIVSTARTQPHSRLCMPAP